MMEHTEARNSHAAERYVLNEMDDAERDRFEEHFFDCIECASDVKAAESFVIAGRAVAKEGGEVARGPASWNWKWPLQAAAMAAAVYVGYLIPHVPSPALISLQPERITLEQERGPKIAPGQLLVVEVPQQSAARYEGEIVDAAGKVVVRSRLQESEGYFYVLPRSLPAGSYSLVIFGVDVGNRRRQLTTHQFEVR